MSIQVSLVSTVLNDIQGAKHLIADLIAQTCYPDEFVVVDGGSRDGTYEFLCAQVGQVPFSLRVLQVPGANVSRGRNLAIEAAEHDVLLTTDFGCRLDSRWVEELLTPFERDTSVEIVTGSWKIPQEQVQTPAQWAEWALANGKLELIATPTCLASTRSLAFKKQVWRDFGKYPEDLSLAGDDAIFSLWMVSSGRRIAAAPNAMCYWHRFPTLKSYWKEARRNFRGAGEALFFLKYGVKVGMLLFLELVSVAVVLAVAIAVAFGLPIGWLVGAIAIALLLWSRRILRWVRAVQILQQAKKTQYWQWVIAFEMGSRIYSIYGYWQGFFHGFWHCQDCRNQVRRLQIDRW
jgi:cellulose synthase/poly-beta-1,6-N-acetylglucosamine synthase-like glycosyltransferase